MHVETEGPVRTEKTLGLRVRDARTARSWTQEEVANRMRGQGFANWNQSTVTRTESATRPVRLGEAVALSAIFGISLNELIEENPLASLMRTLMAERGVCIREQENVRARSKELAAKFLKIENMIKAVKELNDAWGAEASDDYEPRLEDAMRKFGDVIGMDALHAIAEHYRLEVLPDRPREGRLFGNLFGGKGFPVVPGAGNFLESIPDETSEAPWNPVWGSDETPTERRRP